jgi:hypothetical protein
MPNTKIVLDQGSYQDLYSWEYAVICAYADLGLRLDPNLDACAAVGNLLTLVRKYGNTCGCKPLLELTTGLPGACAP